MRRVSLQETPLEVAYRHAALGESLVRRQKAIIRRLRAGGYPTLNAERLLSTLEWTLRLMYGHVAHEHLVAQRQLMAERATVRADADA